MPRNLSWGGYRDGHFPVTTINPICPTIFKATVKDVQRVPRRKAVINDEHSLVCALPGRTIPPAGSLVNGVAFVSLLNTATGALQYSTYLGGTNSDTGYSIASDSAGLAYVTGQTLSVSGGLTMA